VWESFGDVGFLTFEKVWREKKKETVVKYNGSLALPVLEQATIIITLKSFGTVRYALGGHLACNSLKTLGEQPAKSGRPANRG